MKHKIIKALSLFIAVWVVFCFLMSAYNFINKPIFSLENIGRDGYGDFGVLHEGDEIDITVNEFNEGEFYGIGKLTIKSQEARNAYAKGEEINILINNISGPKNFFPIPNWFDVKPKIKIDGTNVFVSEKERINSKGDDFYFPFDTYKIDMSLNFQIYYGKGYEKFEKQADSGTVYYDLPRTFVLSRIEEIPIEKCGFDKCKVTSSVRVDEKDLYHEIKRAKWFIWLSLGLLGIMFAPIILLLKAKVESMSIDIITSLISIYTMRNLLIGASTKVYFLDFIFGFVILCIVVISMLKVAYSSKSS